MTTNTADCNPRVTVTTGHPYGIAQACLHCGDSVDTAAGYLALHAGTRARPSLLAVAHCAVYVGPGDDDLDDDCEHALRCRWEQLLGHLGGGTLRLGQDRGGLRWYLNGEGLHAGTPLELLDAAGTWHTGRFEYRLTATSSTALFCLPLGGWCESEALIAIPADTAVRIPATP